MKASLGIGRWLVASLLVVVGVQHFLYTAFLAANVVPAWIPFPAFDVRLVAVAFLAAAVALTTGIQARLAGTLLGLLFLTFVVTTHMPRIVIRYGNGNEWTSGFVALAMCGGAWLLSSLAPLEERRKSGDWTLR